MAREIIQDIKRSKKSLREILPKEPKPTRSVGGSMGIRRVGSSVSEVATPPPNTPPPPATPRYTPPENNDFSPRRSGAKRSFLLILIILVVAGGAIVLGSSIFARATVTITPKTINLNIDNDLTAKKSDPESGLRFEIMTLETTEGRVVPISGTEDVLQKASGKIKIFNQFSAENQALIKETRFEAENGKIYRIDKAVTVPGYKKNGAEIVPGSVEAMVYADQPGSEYNGPVTKFTIPGFRGGARYDKFWAESVTPLEGGLEGKQGLVAETDRAKVKAETESALRERLLSEAKTRVPPGFVFYDQGMTWTITEQKPELKPGATDTVLTWAGKLDVVIFSVEELSRTLVSAQAGGEEGEMLIANLGELTFTPAKSSTEDVMNFQLSGTAKAVWQIDQEELKNSLTGLSKDGYQSVFAQYPAISRAEVVFRPPWVRSFPEATEKITIRLDGEN